MICIDHWSAERGRKRVAHCMKYPAYLLLTFRFGRLGLGLYKLRSSHHACGSLPGRFCVVCPSMTCLTPFWLKPEAKPRDWLFFPSGCRDPGLELMSYIFSHRSSVNHVAAVCASMALLMRLLSGVASRVWQHATTCSSWLSVVSGMQNRLAP
jgi:hypothetical protein